MRYYLTPGKGKNIEKSIINPINNLIGYNKAGEERFAWCISTNSAKCKSYSNRMKPGDLFMVIPEKNSSFFYRGYVVEIILDSELPKKIWWDGGKEGYECTIILERIEKINISKKILFKCLQYDVLMGITELNEERKGKIISLLKDVNKYNLIDNKLDSSGNEKDIISEDLISRYWNNQNISDINIKWEWGKNKKVRNIVKSKRKKSERKNKSIDIRIVGLVGEKIANTYLHNNISEVIEKLGFSCNDGEVEINWYNKDIDINNFKEDKSIGHGYDIEAIFDSKKKFEVKSSYDGDVNEIVLTRNELIEMKNSKEDYFLVLVGNIKRTPSIKFVRNFSQEFSKEYLNIASKHQIYIEKIDTKYIV